MKKLLFIVLFGLTGCASIYDNYDYSKLPSDFNLDIVSPEERKVLDELEKNTQKKIDDEKKLKEQQNELNLIRRRQYRQEMISNYFKATSLGLIKCKHQKACDEKFMFATSFVSNHAGMKIQIVSNSIVETYSPTENNIAMKLTREKINKEQIIKIRIYCAENNLICLNNAVEKYKLFHSHFSN